MHHDVEEEGSYLEPIRLHQGQSRPLSSASLISNNSSPMSPAANVNVYANNDLLAAAVTGPSSSSTILEPIMAALEPCEVLPPPVAYANAHQSYPKLDDLSDDPDSQQHLYINVGPDAAEIVLHFTSLYSCSFHSTTIS